MGRTEGVNPLASDELSVLRESWGRNDHGRTEQIDSVTHPYPLGLYHFSAIQPSLQLPAPAPPFLRAFSGGSAHMHGRPEVPENQNPCKPAGAQLPHPLGGVTRRGALHGFAGFPCRNQGQHTFCLASVMVYFLCQLD